VSWWLLLLKMSCAILAKGSFVSDFKVEELG
jgi:hypothetical protein